MSYTKLVKKWEREGKLREKQERQARKQRQEDEWKRAEVLYIAQIKEEKRQKELYEQQKQEKIATRDYILAELRKNNPFSYPQFLILWDVFTDNYQQIEADIYKNKISIQDVRLVFEYIESQCNNLLNSYWKNRLINNVQQQ